jgi:N-methylhydantoinase B
MPDKIIAECGGAPTMRALFSGLDGAGDRFSQVLFASGGMALCYTAAMGCRPRPSRPMSALVRLRLMKAWPPGLSGRNDCARISGGAGRFRGGRSRGQEGGDRSARRDEVRLSLLSDRRDHPAQGVLGGAAGGAAG